MNRRHVIKLSASWCMPCRMYASIFNEARESFESDQITFQEIDIDEESALAYKYRVKSVPTTLVLEGDKVIKSQTGSMSYSELEKFITK
jgi:thioredoxin 2